MHAADLGLGMLGANGIVGGGFGIATGAALSAKKRQTGQVSVSFFGDGAANQGLLMEVINLAALWQLPVVYVCENNQFGEYTAFEDISPPDISIGARAAAFGLPVSEVDGNDVLAMYEAASEAVKRARAGEGPSFIEARTYRLRGHHIGDVGFGRGYRTAVELEDWQRQEPVIRFRARLLRDDLLTEAEIAEIEMRVETEVLGAVQFAEQSPVPELTELKEHVYA
jgi:pyruvate dehydrogenase E1 component alpha subunit